MDKGLEAMKPTRQMVEWNDCVLLLLLRERELMLRLYLSYDVVVTWWSSDDQPTKARKNGWSSDDQPTKARKNGWSSDDQSTKARKNGWSSDDLPTNPPCWRFWAGIIPQCWGVLPKLHRKPHTMEEMRAGNPSMDEIV